MEKHHALEEERVQFQVDRVAFFSDAVIAIAITLLILEIKIPPFGKQTTLKDLPRHFDTHTELSLLGMLVCFYFIGNLWIRHHELYQHVRNYNKQLVRTNLYFLLTIMIMPLSTSIAMDEDNPAFIAQAVFFFNMGLCYLAYYWLLWVIFHHKNQFSTLADKQKIRGMKWQTLGIALILVVIAVLAAFGYQRFFVFVAIIPVARRLWGRWKGRVSSLP